MFGEEIMSEHSPLPWVAKHISGNNFAVQEFDIRGRFFGKDGVHPIFNKDKSAIDGTHVFVSPEDAALIVTAVNSHAALVEALRESRDMLIISCGVEHNCATETEKEIIARADAALKLAGVRG